LSFVLPSFPHPTAPTRVAIADAPDKGLAVISGGSNSIVDLPLASSIWSRSRMVGQTDYDKARVYYQIPTARSIIPNTENLRYCARLSFLNGTTAFGQQYADAARPNIEVFEHNLVRMT
jgi:hypothetical protein